VFVFASAKVQTSISGYSSQGSIRQDNEPCEAPGVCMTFGARLLVGWLVSIQPHIIERVLNHVSGAQGGLVGFTSGTNISRIESGPCARGNFVLLTQRRSLNT
jgi:hypothetical protein